MPGTNHSEAARRVVADDDTLVLSKKAADAFFASCENPPTPTRVLRALMALRSYPLTGTKKKLEK